MEGPWHGPTTAALKPDAEVQILFMATIRRHPARQNMQEKLTTHMAILIAIRLETTSTAARDLVWFAWIRDC